MVDKHSMQILARSPLVRSTLYVATAAAMLEIGNQLVRDKTDVYANIHVPALPLVAVSTYAFARLQSQDTAAWHQLPSRQNLVDLQTGLLWGSASIMTLLGIAAARGWISAPAWGWETVPLRHVAYAVARTMVNHLAIAWNEEMVFRGYGLDSLREAVGLPAAATILTMIFAAYHGLGLRALVTYVLAGTILTLLKLERGTLWLPLGFHIAWNIWQVSIFGPADGAPSLRPIHLHADANWIGKPGDVQPGWFYTMVVGVIALVLGLRYFLQRHHKR